MKRTLVALFQIFIVVCLVDGFLDIVYPLLRTAKVFIRDEVRLGRFAGGGDSSSTPALILPAAGFPVRNEPGVRSILKEYHSADINVSADGRRQNGSANTVTPDHVWIVLGSSTAFGFGVSDSQTLAANLERKLPGVQVQNYAGLAQSIKENIIRLDEIQRRNGKPRVAVIAGVGYQLWADCMPRPPEEKAQAPRSSILAYMARRVSETLSQTMVMPCASEQSLNYAIQNTLLEMESALAYAERNGIKLYIAYLPTPYDNTANVDNLSWTGHELEQTQEMRRVIARFRAELSRLKLPGIVDVSDALPADKSIFLDKGGHLSGEGNEMVAELLLKSIGKAGKL